MTVMVPKGFMTPRITVGQKPTGSHFGVGALPVLVYFSWDGDVHQGVQDFDPWPPTRFSKKGGGIGFPTKPKLDTLLIN